MSRPVVCNKAWCRHERNKATATHSRMIITGRGIWHCLFKGKCRDQIVIGVLNLFIFKSEIFAFAHVYYNMCELKSVRTFESIPIHLQITTDLRWYTPTTGNSEIISDRRPRTWLTIHSISAPCVSFTMWIIVHNG